MGEDKGHQIILNWEARTAMAYPPLNTSMSEQELGEVGSWATDVRTPKFVPGTALHSGFLSKMEISTAILYNMVLMYRKLEGLSWHRVKPYRSLGLSRTTVAVSYSSAGH